MMKRVTLSKVIGMIFICLALVSGLCVLGSVGALEQGMVSIARGCVQTGVFMVVTLVLGWLGFAFWDEIL